MSTHRKHAKLERPQGGQFHRTEVGLIGAPCSVIQELSRRIAERIQQKLSIGYVDAKHNAEALNHPFAVKYSDNISSYSVDFSEYNADYQARSLFQDVDGVLVNGNHFKAHTQIVLIHPKKKESLSRKLDRLTDVRCFLLCEGENELYPYLLEHNPSFNEVPVYRLDEMDKIINLISELFTTRIPELKGIVFAGGKSMRMGADKARMNYHGKEQRLYAADLLAQFCDEVFISVRDDSDQIDGYNTIADKFLGLGPYSGLLSAFQSDPNAAWLAVACDIPLLGLDGIRQLIAGRNARKLATCFYNDQTDFPEPMITIWEPRAYPQLLHFLSMGYSCPRKVLINSKVEVLKPENPDILTNVNTPEERQAILDKLNRTVKK